MNVIMRILGSMRHAFLVRARRRINRAVSAVLWPPYFGKCRYMPRPRDNNTWENATITPNSYTGLALR